MDNIGQDVQLIATHYIAHYRMRIHVAKLDLAIIVTLPRGGDRIRRLRSGAKSFLKIKAALSNRESIDNLKAKIHIPILLLHECATTAAATELSENYKAELTAFHKERAESYFLKQLAKSRSVHKYDDLNFHIILFPVPNKKKIVDAFVHAVAFYKGQK